MSPVGRRLADILEKGALDSSAVARIVRASPRTVSRWANDETEPRWEYRERLLELFAVVERLQKVIEPAACHDWLFTPNPALDFAKPVELLREGNFRKVLGVIDSLGEGVFS